MKMKLVSQFFHIDERMGKTSKTGLDLYYAPLLTTLAAAAAGVPSAASITASRCGRSLATS